MNKAVLLGRLTHDPDSRTFDNGKQCAKFSIAVSRIGDGADFFNVVAFDKQASNVCRYLVKGSQVAVVGHIQTGSYEKDGVRRPTFDIIAENVEFIGSRQTSDTTPKQDESIDELKEVEDDDMPF